MTYADQEYAAGDQVTASFGSLGMPVDCAGMRSLNLEGPQVLWLVVQGALDLFAVDAAAQGHWHFLGRLEAGTLLLGPVEGPQHTLVGRPLQGCLLRRIGLRELQRPDYGDASWSYDQQYLSQYDTQDAALSLLEHAFALGVGRSQRVLFEAPLDGRTAGDDSVGDDDILWLPILPGSVQYGASYSADTVGELLVDGSMWQRMVNQQFRLLSALDRWIERLESAHETRTAAGIKAGETVREEADRTLLASIGRQGKGVRGAAPPRGTATTRRTPRASWSRALPGSRSRRPSGAAPSATASTRSSRSPSPHGSAPARSASTGAGGARTRAPWWVTARRPAPRSHCCGGAAGTRPCIRRAGGGPGWTRTTRRSSRRGPSCCTGRCPTGR